MGINIVLKEQIVGKRWREVLSSLINIQKITCFETARKQKLFSVFVWYGFFTSLEPPQYTNFGDCFDICQKNSHIIFCLRIFIEFVISQIHFFYRIPKFWNLPFFQLCHQSQGCVYVTFRYFMLHRMSWDNIINLLIIHI